MSNSETESMMSALASTHEGLYTQPQMDKAINDALWKQTDAMSKAHFAVIKALEIEHTLETVGPEYPTLSSLRAHVIKLRKVVDECIKHGKGPSMTDTATEALRDVVGY